MISRDQQYIAGSISEISNHTGDCHLGSQTGINQILDSGKIVQEAETSAGERIMVETYLEEPLKDFISGMSGDEVLKQRTR